MSRELGPIHARRLRLRGLFPEKSIQDIEGRQEVQIPLEHPHQSFPEGTPVEHCKE